MHDFGRVIEPARLCQYLAGPTPVIVDADIVNITRQDQGLVLFAKNGRQFNYEQIVVATGAGLPESLSQLAIEGVRVDITTGQVSHIPQQAALVPLTAGLSFGGYLTSCHNGFLNLARHLTEADKALTMLMPFVKARSATARAKRF